MSVVSVEKDYESLTLRLVAEFDAPIERVWQLWADPRKLERWWGPPSYPATVETHDLAPGGEVTYFMTGPAGERSHGWWRIHSAAPPRSLAFTDGSADRQLPTTDIRVRLSEHEGGTRMEVHATFGSREQMEQLEGLGAFETFREALGQMDDVLDDDQEV